MANPGWFQTKEVAPQTWAIGDHGQDVMFLLCGSARALLVDTGFGIGDLQATVAELLGDRRNRPLTVVNTHGHVDHASGNWQFPRVYIGTEDVPMVDHPMSAGQRQGLVNRFRQTDESALLEVWPNGLPPEGWGTIVPEIVPIGEGQVFDLGGRALEAISVPGHTRGSICLLDRGQRLLLTGDDVHNGHIWMHLDHSTTMREYLQSLRHLQGWDGTYDSILWGHSLDPVPASLLGVLVAAVEGLLDGRLVGEAHHTFAGDGLRYDFGAGSIIYRQDRLD